MRHFLTFTALLACLSASACRPREKVHLEPTEETAASLQSTVHMSDERAVIQLVRGFHALEQNSWRWTAGKFAVVLKVPPGALQKGGRLVIRLSVPEAVVQKVGSPTLSAGLNGVRVGSATYARAGEHTFEADVPASLFHGEAATFDFALDRFLSGGAVDSRELGVIVSSIGLESR